MEVSRGVCRRSETFKTDQALHTSHWLLGFRSYPVCRRPVLLRGMGIKKAMLATIGAVTCERSALLSLPSRSRNAAGALVQFAFAR